MSRKIRVPKAQIAALPSPAWVFELLAGSDPGCRLPGWPNMFQQHVGEPTAAQVWERHAEALLEEAHRAGFEAFWLTKRLPTGEGFLRWQQQFLAGHRY